MPPLSMTTSGRNVFAHASTEQGRQATQLLVIGGNGAHAGWAAAAKAVLPGGTERLRALAVAEDHRSLQRRRREHEVEAVPFGSRAAGKRSRCGAGVGKESAAGENAAVGTVLSGLGTMAAAEAG